jgi:hypothetical protein
MKFPLLFVLCQVPLSLFGQAVIEGPWKIECGASTSNAFKESASFNLRYISPRFKWSEDEWTEEEEEHPDKFKKTRIMLELIYKPPLKVLCSGLNVHYRFLNYKRLSVEARGGFRFFFIPGKDFENIPPLKKIKGFTYANIGLLCQINLGMWGPFVDLGSDSIITIGTELNIHAIHKNPKKRYKLNKRAKDE